MFSLMLCGMTIVLSGVAPVGEDQLMQQRSERIHRAFNDLNINTMDALGGFYDEQVHFEDPLGSIEGLPALRRYYASMYENVQEISFEFHDEIAQGDKHVVTWTMRMTAKKLNKGRPVTLEGNSVLRFGPNDKVVYHRDYFDMGEFIYRHVPVLRWGIKQVNKRLKHSAQ